jgi:hypothetical protein
MKRTIFLYAALLTILSARAQVAVLPAGGNATGSGGSVSYSVGQIVFTVASGTSGSMVQGVQQPYEISVGTGSPEIPGIKLTLSVYPNPTSDILTLSIENLENASLYYRLYDANGKVIDFKNITNAKTDIDMSNLKQAIYFMNVSDRINTGSGVLKTFKIIKH